MKEKPHTIISTEGKNTQQNSTLFHDKNTQISNKTELPQPDKGIYENPALTTSY